MMLTFLPPIGKLDINGSFKDSEFTEMSANNEGEEPRNVALLTAQPRLRPQSTKRSSDNHIEELARPSSSHNKLGFERGLGNEGIGYENIVNKESSGFEADDNDGWHGCFEINKNDEDMVTLVDSFSQLQKISRENETACERAAERRTDYEQGQPQKLSFEDELTFVPKLNALSLKIAQSRTSVAKRIKVSCESRVAALEEEMAQNFTFRPCISENSLRIADRLKTDFWSRQKLHTEKQRKILENAPITWNQKSKTSFMPKQSMGLPENAFKERGVVLAYTDQLNSNYEGNINWAFDSKKGTPENVSTLFPKNSTSNIRKQKKSFNDLPPKRLESLKPKALKKVEQRRLKSEKIQRSLDDSAIRKVVNGDECSPDQLIFHQPVRNSVDTASLEIDRINKTNKTVAKEVHKRSKTMPPSQVIHRPFVVDPDRFLRTKHAAEQALKSKKVFICMGPYPVLRACLRRRGWIEKNFKGDVACSKSAKERSPDKFSLDSDDDDDNDVDVEDRESMIPANGGSAKEDSPRRQDDARANKTAPCKITRASKGGHGSVDKKLVETKSRYAYGNGTVGNFEDLEHGFESDTQYGIMSRIARNAVPTFIWTCRRSDIDFNYLTKDQIVNHFVHASSFTTKFGLCINIRNVPWFESVDPDSFFPRCHRLSNDNEKQDFIDEFRMLSAIAILRHTVKWYKDEDGVKRSEKLIPARALLLAMKACEGYLKSKEHVDIEEGEQFELYGLSEETWNQLIEFSYQVNRFNGRIVGTESYLNECEQLLAKMEETYPQCNLHKRNIWIVKPGAKSRGRGIIVMDNLEEILKLSSCNSYLARKENKWVVQKYIERPLLIYNTKFDIRQWFLVTDWNPLTLWFYKDCYLRFCSQEFTLTKFEPEYHLANNSIQKDYANGPRSKQLPSDNMWTKDQYVSYLREHGHGDYWDEVICPNMKQSIIYTLEACQDSLEYRKNSFELYGADFMLSDDMRPWLIEINCSPAMGPSTAITEKLCAEVIEDTLKVVLDRKENKSCDTGKFELAYKQAHIPIPVYTGNNLYIEGESCKKLTTTTHYVSPQQSTLRLPRPFKAKEPNESHENSDVNAKKVTPKLSPQRSKKSPEKSPEKIVLHKRDTKYDGTKMITEEIKYLISKEKRANTWQGCLCGTGDKCQVASAYHVQNTSLEVSLPEKFDKRQEESKKEGYTAKRLSKQTLKLAKMHRKAKKKIAYATLKYQRANDGPGLSIGPGHGVTQI